MLKSINWRTLPRDFAVIQLGFSLFGLAIALLIRSQLGTSPWVVFEVAVMNYIPITAGQSGILVGMGVLLLSLAMREQVGWGTITNIIFIGLWEDFFLYFIPPATYWLWQWACLLGGVFFMGIGTAIYIGVNAGAGPRDSLMLAISRTTGSSVRLARTIIEVVVVTTGWLLGGPVGIGTLVFALTIGPSVQIAFQLFKVRPQVKA